MAMDRVFSLLEAARQAILPRKILRLGEGEPRASIFREGCWEQLEADQLPENGLFGQTVLLLPDSLTLFRQRDYPSTHIKRSELREAIELDVATWNPWEAEVDLYYSPSQEGDQWKVAVWIWPRELTANNPLIAAFGVTHIMPDLAWRVAALKPHRGPCLFCTPDSLAVLSDAGTPLQVHRLDQRVTVSTILRRLDETEQELPIVASENVREEDLPNTSERLSCHIGLPSQRSLVYARLPDVADWTDPMSWRQPVGVVFGLYLAWLLLSTGILWHKSNGLAQEVAAARREANEVVGQREKVTEIHAVLTELRRLRGQQSHFERALAEISVNMPEDAWIDAMDYRAQDGGTIDLVGKSASSARLAALFEALPGIQHAMFLGDIRRENDTGLEPFRLRLTLAEDGTDGAELD